jgi:hypothetical protein
VLLLRLLNMLTTVAKGSHPVHPPEPEDLQGAHLPVTNTLLHHSSPFAECSAMSTPAPELGDTLVSLLGNCRVFTANVDEVASLHIWRHCDPDLLS